MSARARLLVVLALVLGCSGVAAAYGASLGLTSSGLAHRTVGAPCVPAWWDAAYGHRRPVTVTTGASAVGTDHAVSVTLDHAALVTGGKSLASGADVRVLALNSATCTWTQLDRVVDDASAWNRADARVWFRLTAAVAAGSSSPVAYFVYYGNPAAGAPPADASSVFLAHDDFPGTSLGAAWTVLRPPATWSVGSGALNVTMDPNEDLAGATDTAPVFSVAATGSVEVQARQSGAVSADGQTAGLLAYATDDSYAAAYHRHTGGAERVDLVREVAGTPTSSGAGVASDPTWLRLTRVGDDWTAAWSADGSAFTTTATGAATVPVTRVGVTAFSTTASTTAVSFTDFRVRRVVAVEPTTGMGAETAQY